jgi:type II secretory ATPase GspE/PulE/Tfp pilus assembly ATPase PilB-like protein
MLKDLGIEALASKKDGFKLWKSKGCSECGMTGYKGRIGIYEVMNFSEDIRNLIRIGSSPKEIIAAARK